MDLMIVRPATIADAEAICDLHIRSIRVLCAKDYTAEQIEAWAGRKKPELYRQAMTDGDSAAGDEPPPRLE